MVPERVKVAAPSFTKAPPTPEIVPVKVVGPDSLMVRLFPVMTTEAVASPDKGPISVEPPEIAEISKIAVFITETAPDDERTPEPDRARVPSLIVVPPE